eukprot:scaffold7473_cov141-Skeletonema_marinoi.AAC.7
MFRKRCRCEFRSMRLKCCRQASLEQETAMIILSRAVAASPSARRLITDISSRVLTNRDASNCRHLCSRRHILYLLQCSRLFCKRGPWHGQSDEEASWKG